MDYTDYETYSNQIISAFRSFLILKPKDSKILDVGDGQLHHGAGLTTLKTEGWYNIVGVDLLVENKLPFKDNSFDYSFHIIEHSVNIVENIKEVVRVTSNEGLIIAQNSSIIQNRHDWDTILSKLPIKFITIPKTRLVREYWSYFSK